MAGRRIGGAGEANGWEISLATRAAWLSFITEPILDRPAARRLIGLAERRPATPPQGANSDDASPGRAAQFGR
jgi:hypothetical protein